ncbi:hypothetical protein ABID19_006572 [Mesorhizobium robiniae]|uniref:Uncharacterized protein n=1 Tax=Mesorhizobium robiniae TaxID=559315 RepID=A0ABV2GZN7_9HYPH|nr:hypothetical protein [Mesorhizobium sp. ZC-5]MCV3243871.1 hypothetical protein [Mesorhizobium sp. ZC-5]
MWGDEEISERRERSLTKKRCSSCRMARSGKPLSLANFHPVHCQWESLNDLLLMHDDLRAVLFAEKSLGELPFRPFLLGDTRPEPLAELF